MPIYGKKPVENLFLQNKETGTLKTLYKGLDDFRLSKFVFNDNPKLTFAFPAKKVILTFLCIYKLKILESQFFKNC